MRYDMATITESRNKADEKAEQIFFFLNWDSLHARLNSHYEA